MDQPTIALRSGSCHLLLEQLPREPHYTPQVNRLGRGERNMTTQTLLKVANALDDVPPP